MRNFERELRWMKAYAIFLTLAVLVSLLSGFQASAPKNLGQIDVERINVVEPDGKVVMVISDRSRFPDPIVGGKSFKRQGGATPGIILYNSQGDEDGGLVWAGKKTADGYDAGAALLFDQFNQDQTVGIMYNDENGKRNAAFHVWDRPDQSVSDISPKIDAVRKMPAGPERQAAVTALRESGTFGAERVYLGKSADHTAALILSDAKGRPRVRISVEASGIPGWNFWTTAER
jgi:hypothetical protein